MKIMPDFKLSSGLAGKDFVIDLSLSRVLMNDKKDFPWVFLVPRKNNITQMNQLSFDDQHQLMDETSLASTVMGKLFPCDRINVAAIGNMTPQLHVHVICRRKDDLYWPDVCWNKPIDLLSDAKKKETVMIIRNEFEKMALSFNLSN